VNAITNAPISSGDSSMQHSPCVAASWSVHDLLTSTSP
jgi:hypothetical protein